MLLLTQLINFGQPILTNAVFLVAVLLRFVAFGRYHKKKCRGRVVRAVRAARLWCRKSP